MCDEKIAIRVLLRHYWKKGLSTRAAAEEICAVEGEGVVKKTTAAEWFKRFNEGDTSLQDKPRSGRPSTVDEALLEAVKTRQPPVLAYGQQNLALIIPPLIAISSTLGSTTDAVEKFHMI